MKKTILLLALLVAFVSFAQNPLDVTGVKKLKISQNIQDETATKVLVQSDTGTPTGLVNWRNFPTTPSYAQTLAIGNRPIVGVGSTQEFTLNSTTQQLICTNNADFTFNSSANFPEGCVILVLTQDKIATVQASSTNRIYVDGTLISSGLITLSVNSNAILRKIFGSPNTWTLTYESSNTSGGSGTPVTPTIAQVLSAGSAGNLGQSFSIPTSAPSSGMNISGSNLLYSSGSGGTTLLLDSSNVYMSDSGRGVSLKSPNIGSTGISNYRFANAGNTTERTVPVSVNGNLADVNGNITVTVGGTQLPSDWTATTGVTRILNKPTLSLVATTGGYNDLLGRPSIPTTTSQLANDGYDTINPFVSAADLSSVAVSGSYGDLTDKPNLDFLRLDGTVSLDSGAGVPMANGASIREGTTNAGDGGNKGIALKCSVDYELKWEAGKLYVMQQDGFTIRHKLYNFNIPLVTDDSTKGFVVGSRWIMDDGSVYACTDATSGSAVWAQVSYGDAGLPSTLAVSNKTNETAIVSNNGQSYLNVFDTSAKIGKVGSGVATYADFQGDNIDIFASEFLTVNAQSGTTFMNPVSLDSNNTDTVVATLTDDSGTWYSGDDVAQIYANGFQTANTATNATFGATNSDILLQNSNSGAVHLKWDNLVGGTTYDAQLPVKPTASTQTIAMASDISALSSTYQPLDSDLTSIAGLSTTSYGRGFLPLTDAAAARTYIGANTGTVTSVTGVSGEITVATGTTTPVIGIATAYTTARNSYADGKVQNSMSATTTVAPSVTAVNTALGSKQDALVSGTSIKTINSNSILGSGNINVGDALTTNPLSQFASTTSSQVLGVVSDETGTGSLVFSSAPTFTNPVVGTQTANDNSTKAASTAYVDAKVQNSMSATATVAPSVTAVKTEYDSASGLTFSGAVDLSKKGGSYYTDHTQTGAITFSVSASTIGGLAQVTINANGNAINLVGGWVNYGSEPISTVNGTVNYMTIWVTNNRTFYSVKVY